MSYVQVVVLAIPPNHGRRCSLPDLSRAMETICNECSLERASIPQPFYTGETNGSQVFLNAVFGHLRGMLSDPNKSPMTFEAVCSHGSNIRVFIPKWIIAEAKDKPGISLFFPCLHLFFSQ